MVENLIRLISDIVDKKLKEYDRGSIKVWVVKAITASTPPNGTCSVYVNGDTSSTPINLKNKSWETITSGQEVYAMSTSGSLSDAVIVYKK